MVKVILKFAVVFATALSCAQAGDLDRFGGWKGKQFEATGFFRTEHDGKRWWLVTPEGNAFISFGINHYHAGWWAQDYNREYWVGVFGAERPWDAAWKRGFREAAISDMGRLGLNTLGIHTDAPMLTDPPGRAAFPYVRRYEPIVLSHYRKPDPKAYVDIFDSAFETQCDAAAQKMAARYANDPMLLGYCMADCPVLTDGDARVLGGTTWPRQLRNLGGGARGKQVYVETMRKRYADIDAFNKTYSSTFESWEGLLAAENWRAAAAPANKGEAADNQAFLLRCVDRYYAVAKRALRRVDANHLFLGDKINANSDTLESIVTVTSRYTDVVNVQFYARWERQKALLDKVAPKLQVAQPFLNGDSTYSVPSEMLPNPYGPHARDQAQRAEWVREFAENAIARPDFVGWHMCGIIDTLKTMPGKAQYQHMGLMTPKGKSYPEMEKVIQDISSRLYEIALAEQAERPGKDRAVGSKRIR
ncbi:MAG: hypothetical protein ACYS8Z_00600 [Planctomycetota bacterium]|jgi:hypothetical protein